MTRGHIWGAVLVAGLWLTGSAQASEAGIAIPGVPTAKEAGDSASKPLDVMNLAAEWWKQLEGDDTRVQAVMDGLQAQLRLLVSRQPPESQTALDARLDNILSSFKALRAIRGKQVPVAEPAPAMKDAYDWQAFLQLMRDMRKQQADAAQSAQDLTRAQQGRDALEKQADKTTAAYLAAKESDRVPLLLDMLERRLAWMISSESVRLQEAQAAVAETKAKDSLQAFTLAQGRLQLRAQDMSELQRELARQAGLLDKAADAVRTAQASVLMVWGDDDQARARSLSEQVGLLGAQVREAQVRVRQLWLAVASAYVQSRLDAAYDWEVGVRGQLSAWQKQGKELVEQRKDWRGQLELKREQAQTSALLLAEAQSREGIVARGLYTLAARSSSELLSELKHLKAQQEDAETLAQLLRETLQSRDGVLKSQWLDMEQSVSQSWTLTLELMNTSLFKIGETPVTTAGILRVVLIITLAWWFSYWLRKGVVRVAARNDKVSPATAYTITRIMHYVIMVVGIMVALSSIGLDFSNVAWIAGALSVGIGFGLQSIVNNFVSGLIIMFERSLKVGDFIELQSGVTGTVSQINMRSTVVVTPDNLEIVVPNAEFISGRVVNWTLSDLYRRVRVPFSVDYGTDKEKLVEVVLAAADRVPYTVHEAEREPQVWMTNLGDNGLEFELLVWVKHGANIDYRIGRSNLGIKAAYLWEIESGLREAGIGVPYPQQDLYVRSVLGARTPQEFVSMMRKPADEGRLVDW